MRPKRKRFKEFILPKLQCIVCYHGKFNEGEDEIQCRGCGQTYPIHNDIPIMTLSPEKALNYSKDIIVENRYSDQWVHLIKKAGNASVMDLGSGNNPDIHGNLLKLEIFALPNVDVVGQGGALPFRAGTFGVVFSGAVFEHVSNPFQVIEQVKRVLMPGGEVYIETAFLQPVHAFPDHYFNMTKNGLEFLCSEFDKLDSGVQPHQAPSFTLKWILTSWARKLSGKEKKAFLNSKVRKIIKEYNKNVFSQRWMEDFTPAHREELACGVYFHGRKPIRPV